MGYVRTLRRISFCQPVFGYMHVIALKESQNILITDQQVFSKLAKVYLDCITVAILSGLRFLNGIVQRLAVLGTWAEDAWGKVRTQGLKNFNQNQHHR